MGVPVAAQSQRFFPGQEGLFAGVDLMHRRGDLVAQHLLDLSVEPKDLGAEFESRDGLRGCANASKAVLSRRRMDCCNPSLRLASRANQARRCVLSACKPCQTFRTC